MKKFNGFTMVEIMVSIIVLSMIVTFAIPSFLKSIEKGRARRARVNLMAIHAALDLYHGNALTFPPTDQGSLANINTALSLNILDDSFNYSYDFVAANQFVITAARSTGAYSYQITQTPISDANPSCAAGTCPL